MIPDFKTFIKESIWSDIQDRSMGKTVRKEDAVNNLDRNEFYDYLKNKYNKFTHLISKDPSEIHIKLGWSYFPQRDYIIDIHWVEKNEIKNLYLNFGPCELNTLCHKNFKIGTSNDGISNEEILNIIDFCLDYISSHKEIESPLNESIWSDIQDRSMGKTVRREDDVNIFDCDELYDYIYSLYEQINQDPMPLKSQIGQRFTYFSIPIFKSGYKAYRLDCTFENNKISKITLMASYADVKDFKQSLIDNFDVTTRGDGALSITAKDGTVSNQVCMDLIKTIIENAPEPYLKKREN